MPSLHELLQKADSYKKKISSARPLTKEELESLDDYFRIGFTYSSNALEGNSLTISETKILLEDGITVGGRPLKDCYEAVGHGAAYDFMLTLARQQNLTITEDVIQNLHRLFSKSKRRSGRQLPYHPGLYFRYGISSPCSG